MSLFQAAPIDMSELGVSKIACPKCGSVADGAIMVLKQDTSSLSGQGGITPQVLNQLHIWQGRANCDCGNSLTVEVIIASQS